MVKRNLFTMYLLTRCLPLASGAPSGAAFPRRPSLAPQSRRHRAPPARSRVCSVRVPGEVGLHRVEQVEVIRVVGFAVARYPHRQYDLMARGGGVPGGVRAVEGAVGKAAVVAPVLYPLHSLGVELRVGS